MHAYHQKWDCLAHLHPTRNLVMDIEIGVGDTRPPNVLEHTLSLPFASSNGVEVAA